MQQQKRNCEKHNEQVKPNQRQMPKPQPIELRPEPMLLLHVIHTTLMQLQQKSRSSPLKIIRLSASSLRPNATDNCPQATPNNRLTKNINKTMKPLATKANVATVTNSSDRVEKTTLFTKSRMGEATQRNQGGQRLRLEDRHREPRTPKNST